MNKLKKLIITAMVLVLAVAIISPIQAGLTDTITVTLQPQATASISCNQSTWIPSAALGGHEQTSTTWGNLSNDGEINVSVTIKGSNTTAWTIHDTTTAHNQFVMRFYNGAAWEGFDYDEETFSSDLPAYGTDYKQFGLNVSMPSTSSTNTNQTVTITFTATAL